MIKKKIYLITLITIIGTIVAYYVNNNNPTTSTQPVIPDPPKSQKSFQFDSSTDLGKELDSINPQVLESDFDD